MGAERPRRIAAVDGLRGLAILGVVVLHRLLVSGSPWGSAPGFRGTITWAVVLGNVTDIFFILPLSLVYAQLSLTLLERPSAAQGQGSEQANAAASHRSSRSGGEVTATPS